MADDDLLRPSVELLEAMRVDMQLIDDYGAQHSDEYGGHWFEDHQRAYGVSFTGSLENHETALRSMLRCSDLLRVRDCTHTHAFLRHMQDVIVDAEILKNPDGTVRIDGIHGVGVDVRRNLVTVFVLPDRPDVETRLANRYGEVIRLERRSMAQPI